MKKTFFCLGCVDKVHEVWYCLQCHTDLHTYTRTFGTPKYSTVNLHIFYSCRLYRNVIRCSVKVQCCITSYGILRALAAGLNVATWFTSISKDPHNTCHAGLLWGTVTHSRQARQLYHVSHATSLPTQTSTQPPPSQGVGTDFAENVRYAT